MSITDELRKYAQDWRENPNLMDDLDAGDIDGLLGDFEHIADRIDAEHEQQMAERRRSCVFYDAERNYCKVHDEGDMAELGYVRLPVDTDGVPIRIGDVMENIVCPPVHREVTGVGAECFYGWDEGNGRYSQFGANCYRHHHKPTVEDVLREMLCAWEDTPTSEGVDGIIAEYAGKLRLAKEGE